jgi:hypothetical protein
MSRAEREIGPVAAKARASSLEAEGVADDFAS